MARGAPHASSFTLERLDQTGALYRVTFTRGEVVKAWLHTGEWMFGTIAGISRANGTARIRRYGQREGGIWFPFGAIYPLEPGDPGPPQPKARPTISLSRALELSNRRNEPPGGWSDADAVAPQPRVRRAPKRRRSPMGFAPPGGWTEADRVK